MTNRTVKWILTAMASAMILMAAADAMAQSAAGTNGGNGNRRNRAQRDPARLQAQRLERYRTLLEITSDDEWKVLQPRIEKVLREQGETRVRPDIGRNRRGNRESADATTTNTNRVGNPDAEALKSASAAKLSKEEMAKRLTLFRAAQKAKEDALAKDQDELRKLLSVRQEAIAVLNGLLK